MLTNQKAYFPCRPWWLVSGKHQGGEEFSAQNVRAPRKGLWIQFLLSGDSTPVMRSVLSSAQPGGQNHFRILSWCWLREKMLPRKTIGSHHMNSDSFPQTSGIINFFIWQLNPHNRDASYGIKKYRDTRWIVVGENCVAVDVRKGSRRLVQGEVSEWVVQRWCNHSRVWAL